MAHKAKWRNGSSIEIVADGDVVMWDNVPTQHIAIFDYALPQRRLLHRATLTGTRPF